MAKLTVDQLVTKILNKVDEESFTSADALQALNECNVNIATELYIKELATVSEVTISASANTVSFPDDFLREFVFAYNKTTKKRVKVYASRRLLDRKVRGFRDSGDVMYACNDYPNVYIQYTPASDQVLDIYYCGLPDDLTSGGSFPGYIPSNYVYNIYFNYACSQLYDYIEDGGEGEKVNTLYHMDLANKNLEKLKLFIGPDPDEPFMPDDVNNNFDFSDY